MALVRVSSEYSSVLVFFPRVVGVGVVFVARNGVILLQEGRLFHFLSCGMVGSVRHCLGEEAFSNFSAAEIFESLSVVGRFPD